MSFPGTLVHNRHKEVPPARDEPIVGIGTRFLTRRLCPLELPRAPWGDDQLSIDFAGGPYRFDGLARSQAALVKTRFQQLCHADSVHGVPVRTELYRLPSEWFRPIDTRGWEYSFDREYSPTRVRMVGPSWVGEVEPGPPLLGRLWTSETSADGFPGVFENFFRALVAYRLLLMGGVLLHSAAFADTRGAHVAVGISGAGKSTLSRLALNAGLDVLSDDLNALMPGPGGWVAERIPFAGDLAQAPRRGRSCPVHGLYALEQAERHALERLPAAMAMARLSRCAPIVNADPERADTLLENLAGLVGAVGMSRLRFAADEGVLAGMGISGSDGIGEGLGDVL